MKRTLAPLLFALSYLVASSGCGSGSSTPTAPTGPAATRIIGLSGNLNFGNVNFGDSPSRTITISNSGNATLTFSGATAVGGTANKDTTLSQTSGSVPAGGSVQVTFKFTPTLAQAYSTAVTFTSDATSGTAAINFTGTGINNTPIFSKSGVGNNIFTIPASVTKLHIVGTFTGSSSNFVVFSSAAGVSCGNFGGPGCSLLVNDIIGTFVGRTVSDGVLATLGGTNITVVLSDGVSWTMTEVR